VDRVLKYMRSGGTTILTEVSPLSIEKLESGKLRVEFSTGETEDFDTVLAAIGRFIGFTFLPVNKCPFYVLSLTKKIFFIQVGKQTLFN
jgi:hypothetical protein